MNPEKIGKFICELRKEKGLSQYQLADLIPISRQGVSKWERGVTTPDPQTLIQLSEFFNVTIDELLRGERSDDNSIEKLEETTLSILDQSNKKTKTIKRITTTFISITLILLLAFLSYYFINSYNSIEVYTIGGKSKKFMAQAGIFVKTREKYYLKLGKINNQIDADINNIKLIYKKGKKSIVLVEDQEVDNIVVMDSYGYKEKFSKKDIDNIKKYLYLEITYNETEKEVFKIRCERDYKNSSLFFINQRKVVEKKITKEETITEKVEEKKEEVEPTINETIQNKEQDNKVTENKQKEETPKNEQTVEEHQEIVITPDMVINRIKETCPSTNGAYSCECNNLNAVITYHSIMNKLTLYRDENLVGHYFVNQSNYICTVDDCETIFNNTFKECLFS